MIASVVSNHTSVHSDGEPQRRADCFQGRASRGWPAIHLGIADVGLRISNFKALTIRNSSLEIRNDAMTCDDIQDWIALYCDDGLSEEDRAQCDRHLEVCPVCREHVTELRAMRLRLATMSRVAPPAGLASEIQFAVRAEVSVQRAHHNAPTSEIIADFLS